MPKNKITIQSKRTGAIKTIIDESQTPTLYEVGDLTTGIPFIDTIEDGLKTAVLAIRNAEDLTVEPFDVVNIYNLDSENEESQCYIVGGKHTAIDNEYLLKHELLLNLVEPTKILDTVKIFTLNITDKELSLNEQITYLLNNCEILINSQEPRFENNIEISPTIMGEDFFFENTTLRNALDEMLSVVNMRCAVERVELDSSGKINKISVKAISKTQIVDIPYDDKDVTYYSSDIELENYAGEIVARGYNTITKNAVKVINEYFTTNEPNLSTSNGIADLHYPIEELKSFKISGIPVGVDVIWFEDDIQYRRGISCNFPVEIVENLIEQSLFNLLDEVKQRDYLPYAKGETSISVSLSWKGVFGKTYPNLHNIVESSIAKINNDELKQYLIANNIPDTMGDYEYLNHDFTIVDVIYSDTSDDFAKDFKNYRFTAEFIPRIDTALKISKAREYDSDILKMSVMDSQSAKTIDLTRHAKHLFSAIERAGNEEKVIDFVHKSFDSILPLLGRFNGGEYKDYIIYKREYSVFDNIIKAKYYMSKNYNLIQDKIGVNREYRIFNIPQESNNAPIVVKRFLEMNNNGSFPPTSLQTPEYFLPYFYQIFGIEKPEIVEPSHLFLWTNEARNVRADGTAKSLAEDEVFALPLIKLFAGNSIGLMASPKDNFNVGFSRGNYQIKAWGGGVQILYAPYTDNKGKTNGFNLAIGSINENADTSKVPIIKNADITYSGDDALFVKRQKDRTECPQFNLLSQFKSEKNSNVIFGDLSAIFTDNDKTIDIYFDDHKYLDGEVAPSKTAKLMGHTNGSFTVSKNSSFAVYPRFETTKTVVIAHKGRLLCAFNDGVSTTRSIWLNLKEI